MIHENGRELSWPTLPASARMLAASTTTGSDGLPDELT